MHTRRYTLFAVALAGLACLLLAAASTSQALTDKQKVGRSLFFDTNLSEPAGQACAACHGRNVGWTGPDASVNLTGAVYPGAFPGASATASRPRLRMPAAARGSTTTLPQRPGSAACSGMGERRVTCSATR